jgi:hypothetical protein
MYFTAHELFFDKMFSPEYVGVSTQSELIKKVQQSSFAHLSTISLTDVIFSADNF